MLNLFKPGKIGKLEIKNRIVMAPMGAGGLVEADRRLSQRAIDYYAARARGGVGLIITGITYVGRELEVRTDIPIVDSGKYAARFSELAREAHRYGAKVCVQLTCGRGRIFVPNPSLPHGGVVSVSPLPDFWDPSVIAREITIEEIEQQVRDYEFSARIISSAGIDAIEIHAHQGYLIDQFATALWNKRTDKYGGSLDNRLRFPLEIIAAVKRGAGADYPLSYRFGLTHFLEGGRTVEEGLEIARRIEAAGVDALHVDAGCYETNNRVQPPTTQPMGCLVEMAAMAKKVVSIPVIAVGKLGSPELAERVLQEGKADFIAIGRSLLTDPEWPNKVREGKVEDIRPCIGCHEGCMNRVLKDYIHCALNPQTGMERELDIKPAEKKRSVLVVGGGPGGMEAARVAALRGHKVTLWEKGDALGGSLIPAAVPDFKEEYRRLINYLSTQIKKLGVTIELRKEATPELIKKMKPDVVFLATGGKPIIPQIRGVERKSVVTAVDVLLGKKAVGKTVVVIGGGMVGCETALYLAQKGKKVTVVEMLDSVMRDLYWINAKDVRELLDEAGAEILTSTRALEITGEGVAISVKDGKTSILRADTVVLATGMEPEQKLLKTLKAILPEVHSIGDCIEPRKVINAIWEAYDAARLI